MAYYLSNDQPVHFRSGDCILATSQLSNFDD